MNRLSKASRGLVNDVRTSATNIPWMIWSSIRIAQSVASYIYERIRTRCRTATKNTNPLHQKMLNMTEKRMAFYARILAIDGESLLLSKEEAEEWRRDLPKAIEAQYAAIDRGCLPTVMTLEHVRALKRRSLKTLG